MGLPHAVIDVPYPEGRSSSSTFGVADERVRSLLARPYVGFTQPAGAAASWVEHPGETITLILNLDEPFGGLPDAFMAGLSETFSVVETAGAINCIDLKLRPLGGFTLFGVPMHEIAGRVVDVREVLGPSTDGLVEALREARGWDRRFAILDRFLVDRAVRGAKPAPSVDWALRRILASGGRISIGQLAAEIGWSRRHLAAMFRQQVGLRPKTMARIVRFNGLLRRMNGENPMSWAEVALEHGYYDQAHLHRDFRQFLGISPAAFVAGGTQVSFFQDHLASAT